MVGRVDWGVARACLGPCCALATVEIITSPIKAAVVARREAASITVSKGCRYLIATA